MLSPLTAYEHAIQSGFVDDAAQRHAVAHLQQCYRDLSEQRRARGVYLWGKVGRGKTWLMDTFYTALTLPARRQHFHHFMRDLHRALFALTGSPDPLVLVADQLQREIRVLCFDEMAVTDIGDAILLGRLFTLLFERGIVIVATSNLAPSQLYANGFNRERFLPAIAAIEQHMTVVHLEGDDDHRLHPDQIEQRYFVRASSADSILSKIFATLSTKQHQQCGSLLLSERSLNTIAYNDSVIYCHFNELCEKPWSANDFIALCDRFALILLGAVPSLSGSMREAKIARGTEDGVTQVIAGDRQLPTLAAHDDAVRRFIALVDECYDRRIPLYIEADVALEALYTEGYLLAPFQRTLSRIKEMQWQRFGKNKK